MNDIEKIVSKHGGKLAGADKALRRKLRALVRKAYLVGVGYPALSAANRFRYYFGIKP